MQRYRISYGNGQVHYPGSAKECVRQIRAYDLGNTSVTVQEQVDPGEWRRSRKLTEQAHDTRVGA
jgi:hypothetical protein